MFYATETTSTKNNDTLIGQCPVTTENSSKSSRAKEPQTMDELMKEYSSSFKIPKRGHFHGRHDYPRFSQRNPH